MNNGMMFAYFRSKGITPAFNDKLNTLASGILIRSYAIKNYIFPALSSSGPTLSRTFCFLLT